MKASVIECERLIMDTNTEGDHQQRYGYMTHGRHDGESCEIAQYEDSMPMDCEWHYTNISYGRLALGYPMATLNENGLITGMFDGSSTYNESMTGWTLSAESGFDSQWSTLSLPGPPSTMILPPSTFNSCCVPYPREFRGYLEPTPASIRESTPEYVRFGEEASSRFSANLPAPSGAIVDRLVPGHAPRSHSVQFPLPPCSNIERPILDAYHAVEPSHLEAADTSKMLLPGPSLLQKYLPELQCSDSNWGLTKDLGQFPVSSRRRRVPNDLYTPIEIDGFGIDRVGKCTLCSPPRWLKIKNSEYWYDKMFRHGINAATGEAFKPPSEVRVATGQGKSSRKKVTHITEGRCHNCGTWLPLGKRKEKRYLGVAWIRHAYKVSISETER